MCLRCNSLLPRAAVVVRSRRCLLHILTIKATRMCRSMLVRIFFSESISSSEGRFEVPGPSRNHAGIQQGRPNSYPAASYQAPNVGVSSHMGTGQGMPVSGPSREARYTTSSSSLAGALDETPYARGLSAAVPQTTVNKQDHRTVEQVASNVSATLPATSGRRDNVRSWAINEILSGGAVETALASLSDEELRLAQREIDSIARNQSQGTSIPLSKHSLDAAHHSNSSVPTHQAQDAPAISSGGFTAAPLSNVS